MTPDEIVNRYEALSSERENLDAQFELIERFVMPGKGRFFSEGHDWEQSIDWRHREIFDGTACNALQLLAAHVHTNLTSPSQEWFTLRFRQQFLNDDHTASKWLEECGLALMAAIQDSTFNLEVGEFYTDGAGYGTAVMLHDENDGQPMEWNGHRFRAEMQRECYFEESFDRRPFSIFIKRSYSPGTLATKFGYENLPQRVKDKLDIPSAVEKDEEVIHAIYLDFTNADSDTSTILPPQSRPYQGKYIMVEGREQLGDTQGFYEMPAYVLRWQRTAGSKYGHSPSLIALGDILTLQEMVQMTRTATEKAVDPPMKTTRRGIIGDLELFAGGVTQVRDMNALDPLMPPGAYRVDVGWRDIEDLRKRIEQYYHIDQLQLKESPAMTATEVNVRYEMMQRLLGPTLGRIQTDFLDPMISRSFWMMYRKGALPEMPQIVQENQAQLDVDYVGPLARSQKMATVDGIVRWLGTLSQMSQFPGGQEVLDIPEYDEIGDYMADVLGVPRALTRPQTDRDTRRQQRAQAAQEAAQAEQAAKMGAALKSGAAGMESLGMAPGPADLAGITPELPEVMPQ